MFFNFNDEVRVNYTKLCFGLRNYIFLGSANQDDTPMHILMSGFQNTDIKTLKRRYYESMSHYYVMCQNEYPKGSFHPFHSFVNRMRCLFTVDDILKMWQINAKLYNCGELQMVYQKYPELAKQYYQAYARNTGSPKNLDKFGVLFNVKLNNQQIDYIFRYRPIEELQIAIKYFKYNKLYLEGPVIQNDNVNYEETNDKLYIILNKQIFVKTDDPLLNRVLNDLTL